MKTLIGAIIFTLACSAAYAKDVQLFNPNIFGQTTSNAVRILQDKRFDEIEPGNIILDIKNNKFVGATVLYSKPTTFAEVRDSLNRLYKNSENMLLFKEGVTASWSIEDKKFVIQLSQEENRIRVIYIQFQK
jgi:hypothetical protein